MIKIFIPGLPTKTNEYRRGDVTILHDENNNCLVIDGGMSDLTNKMLGYLKSNNLTTIDFILTHWHSDHDYGLRQILAGTDITIKNLYCPPATELSKISSADANRGKSIINTASQLGVNIIYPTNGQ